MCMCSMWLQILSLGLKTLLALTVWGKPQEFSEQLAWVTVAWPQTSLRLKSSQNLDLCVSPSRWEGSGEELSIGSSGHSITPEFLVVPRRWYHSVLSWNTNPRNQNSFSNSFGHSEPAFVIAHPSLSTRGAKLDCLSQASAEMCVV